MFNFVFNVVINVWAFAGWYLAGLGPALVLLPNNRRRELFLLAPLIGMCLIALIGLFEITTLLVPLTPRFNMGVLGLISLLLCFWIRRKNFKIAWQVFRRYLLMLWLPSLALLLVFAWLFHNNGLHLLVGGSDQLQYSENARHIAEEMHTGSPRDIPVARQDHYVYEGTTRVMPYLKGYRRGAEVLLATNAAWTKLSYEETFPVTILCALLTLAMVLSFIGRNFFQLSVFACLVLQVTFLSSFYFFLLQIQGSLALTLSLAPGLGALVALSRAAQAFSWKWLLLAAIILAGYFAIYAEPALISMIFPSVLIIGWELRKSIWKSFFALQRLLLVYLMVFVCAPYTLASVIANASYNLSAVYAQFLARLSMPATAVQAASSSSAQQWSVAGPILGITSYYDSSAFNAHVAAFFGNTPILNEIIFLVLCGFGCLGFFKITNRLGRVFAITLMLWALASLILARHEDMLRLVRSLQYATPFALLGLVLLVFPYSRSYAPRWQHSWTIATWIGRLLLICFISVNVFTDARTISYITSHDISNDPILVRFDDRGTPWQSLKDELHLSSLHNSPVLFSGFKETIRPLAIAITIRAQPHMLGKSISSFWTIYSGFITPLNFGSLCSNHSVSTKKTLIKLKSSNQFLTEELCTDTTQLEKTVLNTVINFQDQSPIAPVTHKISTASATHANSTASATSVTPTTSAVPITSASSFIAGNGFIQDLLAEEDKKHQVVDYSAVNYFNTRLSGKEFKQAQESRNTPWRTLERELLALTEQAVVPVGNDYPTEWSDSKDVYAPRIKRFTNICDVVYRRNYAVVLGDKMASPLSKDAKGLFRRIAMSGPILVRTNRDGTHLLTLNYEGNLGDIKLKVGDRIVKAQALPETTQFKIETNVSAEDMEKLKLIVTNPVKLRSMSWTPSINS